METSFVRLKPNWIFLILSQVKSRKNNRKYFKTQKCIYIYAMRENSYGISINTSPTFCIFVKIFSFHFISILFQLRFI